MDWVSLFLSLFGLGQGRADRIADRRAEAFRLTAEVAGDVGRALDLIDTETARLLARCAQVCPDEPAAAESCSSSMAKIKADAQQLQTLADTVKGQVVAKRGLAEWDRLIRDLNEWRATASRLVPWIEGVVGRFDAVLDGRERGI